ncbi:MAG TPA: LLM class flavin-dependent oxidoreductase [Actinobacteria bacterium]|nr:phthiodiolone/phenolphthiodiolone dimycocerosates ketoreductase [bacterium BMS3Bbin02]HDL41495.1 LLM class flavin-dependent oxidoreductase [Actinomycetota bacterium]
MSQRKFTIGMTVGTQPPLKRIYTMTRLARALRVDVAWTIDHFLGFFPQAVWDKEFSWMADPNGSPHAYFEWQTVLGNLAKPAGSMQLGVGVTESIRRHPVVLAQAAMTLAHMTKRPPIIGIGAGERENIEPYGLAFDTPVGRLEEALQVIRLMFDSQGPVDFSGEHFTLDRGVLDLRAPSDRRPELWIAAHGPRMLRLAGQYGDGWYPTFPMTPSEYESKIETIRSHAGKAGRDADAIVAGWQAFVVLARTERAAHTLLSHKAVRFTALLGTGEQWKEFGASHPLGDDFRGMVDFVPQRYGRAEIDAMIAKVPTDLLLDAMLVGTPKQLRAKLHDYADAGLRHIVLQPVSAMVSKGDAVFSLRHSISVSRKVRRDVNRRIGSTTTETA